MSDTTDALKEQAKALLNDTLVNLLGAQAWTETDSTWALGQLAKLAEHSDDPAMVDAIKATILTRATTRYIQTIDGVVDALKDTLKTAFAALVQALITYAVAAL